jgi:hypothetical protein
VHKILLASLVVPLVAFAAEPSAFNRAKAGASPVGGLSSFLGHYIGDCGNEYGTAQECRARANAFRQKSAGKRYYMVVSEDSTLVSPGSFDSQTGQFTVNVTPFFGANGMALTQGKPRKTDDRGNPILPYITMSGKAPDNLDEGVFSRMASSRGFRLEVVFSPEGVWEIPKRGGGKVQGVKGRIEAMLLSNARTGETLAVWTGR